MLALIVVGIMLGFPTAFTLMGHGCVLRLARVLRRVDPWTAEPDLDLMVQRTYWAMSTTS